MSFALDLFTVIPVSLGALFFLAGTLGLLRFPDTLTRLHALTKADNLGLGLVVAGLLPQVSTPLAWLGLIAVWLLALLTGATVGQLLAIKVHRASVHPGRKAATDGGDRG
jgi:multicomponent Na+:H+ antiporter subunit G